jgi:lipopolysaccharide export system permease protein
MTRGIFFRHVLREIVASTLVVALVLLVVLATYQLSFVLGRAADGQVPGAMVPELALLSLRTSLTVILPFALLLGIVLALGRLYHDNEIAAALACGVPASVLFTAAGVAIVVTTVLAGCASLSDRPRAARRMVELRTAAVSNIAARQLVPGTFTSPAPGLTIYFGTSAADGSLQDVVVQRDLPGAAARIQVVLARSARYRLAPDGDAWTIELADGRSYEGAAGAADWRITSFARQMLKVPVPRASLRGPPRVDGLTNRELLAGGGPRQLAELHWRIGWVIEVMVLGLAAVALARLAPRQGRYARLPWAVLLFGIYAGLLTAGRTMFARGELPTVAGLWWAHALAIVAILVLLRVSRRA